MSMPRMKKRWPKTNTTIGIDMAMSDAAWTRLACSR